jgi:opacity protein-like surface antigen
MAGGRSAVGLHMFDKGVKMMRNGILLACAAGVALMLSVAAHAQDQGTWETSLGIAFMNSSDADFEGGTTADFDSDTAFRAAFDYAYTDDVQVGMSFGLGQRDYTAEIAGDLGASFSAKGDLDYMTLLVNGTYNFMEGPFRPFVTAGIGWSWVDTNIATEPPQTGCWWDPWYGYICTSWQDTRTLDGLTYALGIGARYDFSDQFAIHGSYRIDWIDFDQADGTPDFDGFELSVGWKF